MNNNNKIQIAMMAHIVRTVQNGARLRTAATTEITNAIGSEANKNNIGSVARNQAGEFLS